MKELQISENKQKQLLDKNLFLTSEKKKELQKSGSYDEYRHRVCLALNPESIAKINPISISQSILMCSPKMSELVKYRGPGFAKMTLINLVAELNFLLSSDNGLNKIQLEAAGKLVLSDYYFFSVSDFKLCFKNGLKGKYGKIFGKLSIPVIFEWLREFHVEWLAESQRLANNERLKPVKPVDNPIKPEQAKAIIEAVNSVPAKAKIEYKSLEHYCEFTGKNYHEFAKEFAHQVQDEYKKYLEYFNSKTDTNNEKLCILEYRNYKEKSLLNSLNKKDKSALRNDALKEYSKKIFELKTQGL